MKWSSEEVDILTNARNRGCTWQEVTDILNDKFGTSRTLCAVKIQGRKSGVTGSHEPYTKEQDEWIFENVYKYDNYENLARDFNKIFGSNKKGRGIQSHAVRYLGIVSGRQAFKKGIVPHNRREVGSERTLDNGYIYVKIACGKDTNKTWIAKQRVIYLQNNGEIPKGHNIIFLDGNKTNFSPENLACISNRTQRILQSRAWYFNNSKLTEAAIKVVELENILKEETDDN